MASLDLLGRSDDISTVQTTAAYSVISGTGVIYFKLK